MSLKRDDEIGPTLQKEAATTIRHHEVTRYPRRITWDHLKGPGYCFRARDHYVARRAVISRVWNSLRFDGAVPADFSWVQFFRERAPGVLRDQQQSSVLNVHSLHFWASIHLWTSKRRKRDREEEGENRGKCNEEFFRASSRTRVAVHARESLRAFILALILVVMRLIHYIRYSQGWVVLS